MKIKSLNGTKSVLLKGQLITFDKEGFANVKDDLVKGVKSIYFEEVKKEKKKSKE